MCVFCKIVNKDIPAHIIYEDESVLAILDISQATPGHTLIIPKEHTENYLDCPTEILNKVTSVSQTIGNKIITNLGAQGMNIIANVNEIAGQTIMHFHLHLIPRYDLNDGISISIRSTDNIDLEKIANNIIKD